MIELIAFGMIFSGFSVSPAATPHSSTDAYAKTTPWTTRSIGMTPDGKMPPLSVMVDRPGVWPPMSWLVATR